MDRQLAAVCEDLRQRPELAGGFNAVGLSQGGLLFRAYPDQWLLGAAAKVGGPRIHGRSAQRPSLDELEAGFSRIKEDTSLVAGGVLSAAGAAAALQRRGDEFKSDDEEPAATAEAEGSGEVLPGADQIKKFFGVD